jgi:hypothetical protein
MSWSVQIFGLVSNRADPSLFCSKGELALGGVPLLVRTNSGLKPRSSDDLQQVFDAAYGINATDAISRLPCLQSIGQALNAGDLSYAAMLSLMLRLPEIDPSRMSRLRQMNGTIGKYDDNEDRDQRVDGQPVAVKTHRQRLNRCRREPPQIRLKGLQFIRQADGPINNQRAAEFWRKEFADLGYKITVKYTPFIPATVKIFIA